MFTNFLTASPGGHKKSIVIAHSSISDNFHVFAEDMTGVIMKQPTLAIFKILPYHVFPSSPHFLMKQQPHASPI